MLSRVSGVGAFYVIVQDPNNPSNLPNHSNYTWTAAPDTSELVISHTEYVPWSCLFFQRLGAASSPRPWRLIVAFKQGKGCATLVFVCTCRSCRCGVPCVACVRVWCASSSNYQAPATYLIAVYGRTQASYTIVATAAAASVIEAEDGQSYDARVVAPSSSQAGCKYFQCVAC